MEKFVQRFSWMKGNKKSKWKTKEEWHLKVKPNYRSIRPEELPIETDFPLPEHNKEFADKISETLQKQKISHTKEFSGKKSYYLMPTFPELKQFSALERPTAKKVLIKELIKNKNLREEIDSANFGSKRMIGILNKPHKETGKPRTLIAQFDFGENKIPPEIIKKIKIEIKKKPAHSNPKTNFSVPSKCPFCEFACKNTLPVSGRNINLLPNFVAIMPKENWLQCAETQGKPIGEFERWNKLNPEFNCVQLQKYAERMGAKEICKKCPHRLPLTQEEKNTVNLIRLARRV